MDSCRAACLPPSSRSSWTNRTDRRRYCVVCGVVLFLEGAGGQLGLLHGSRGLLAEIGILPRDQIERFDQRCEMVETRAADQFWVDADVDPELRQTRLSGEHPGIVLVLILLTRLCRAKRSLQRYSGGDLSPPDLRVCESCNGFVFRLERCHRRPRHHRFGNLQ
jgi:hypothetical protein